MEKQTENQSHQDFDLLASIFRFFGSIKQGIIRFSKAIVYSCLWIFNKLIRNFFLWILLLAGLICWAYFFQKETNYYYESKALVYCNGFDNFTLDQTIQKLNSAIQNKNTNFLSSKLNLTEEECSKLIKVDMGVGIDLDNDGIPNQIRFENKYAADQYYKEQILRTKDEGEVMKLRPKSVKIPELAMIHIVTQASDDLFPKLTKAVIDYLNTNPELHNSFVSYSANTKFALQTIDNQIKLIDSLQKIEYLENSRKQKEAVQRDLYLAALMSSNSNLTTKEAKQISSRQTMYYEDILLLIEERNELQKKYDQAQSPLYIVSDFIPERTDQHTVWFWKPILFSIILTLIIGSIVDYRKNILAYIRKQRR